MKKIIAAVAALIMILGLCGCDISITKPEDVVQEFMEAMKNKDEDVLILYSNNADLNLLLHDIGGQEQMDIMYEGLMQNMTWEIAGVKVDKKKGTASVELSVSNSDFSTVLTTYQAEAVKYTKDNLQKESFTKEFMGEECMRIFAQSVQSAAIEDTAQTQNITVNLTKNDNYGWDMELTDEMMALILGNIEFPI